MRMERAPGLSLGTTKRKRPCAPNSGLPLAVSASRISLSMKEGSSSAQREQHLVPILRFGEYVTGQRLAAQLASLRNTGSLQDFVQPDAFVQSLHSIVRGVNRGARHLRQIVGGQSERLFHRARDLEQRLAVLRRQKSCGKNSKH